MLFAIQKIKLVKAEGKASASSFLPVNEVKFWLQTKSSLNLKVVLKILEFHFKLLYLRQDVENTPKLSANGKAMIAKRKDKTLFIAYSLHYTPLNVYIKFTMVKNNCERISKIWLLRAMHGFFSFVFCKTK